MIYYDELLDKWEWLYDEFKFDDMIYACRSYTDFKELTKKPYIPAHSYKFILHNKFCNYLKIFHPWIYWKIVYTKFAITNNI